MSIIVITRPPNSQEPHNFPSKVKDDPLVNMPIMNKNTTKECQIANAFHLQKFIYDKS